MNKTYCEDLSAADHSNYFLHHQAKLASEIFHVKWSKMIKVIIARIVSKIENNIKAANYLINSCRSNGVSKKDHSGIIC